MGTIETDRLIKLLRELRGGESIRSFCSKTKINYGSWTAWEGKQTWPGLESLEEIARLKGWNLVQLISYLKHDNPEKAPYSVTELLEYGRLLPFEERVELARQLLQE